MQTPQVRARLTSPRLAPAMLVNVVGARGWGRVVSDLLGLVRSRTLMLQLCYGLVQTVLLRLFPELGPRLEHLQPRSARRMAATLAAGGGGVGSGGVGASGGLGESKAT